MLTDHPQTITVFSETMTPDSSAGLDDHPDGYFINSERNPKPAYLVTATGPAARTLTAAPPSTGPGTTLRSAPPGRGGPGGMGPLSAVRAAT